MVHSHLRFAALGAMLGLMVALTPGCQKQCGAENCATGCCTDKGECVSATSATQCGTNGAKCGACTADQTCTAGACVTPMGGGSGDDGGADAGPVDAGPPPCTNDFECGAGLICTATGECVTGTHCQADYECQSQDTEDRCSRYGQQCVCDTTATGGGTCRVRKGPCEECTTDLECGPDTVIFGPPDGIGAGKCKTLPDDMTGKKYCSYQRVGQCACGTIDDGTGYCRPQSNSCDSVGCNVDRDCSQGSVCSVNNPNAMAGACGGICVPRCNWNFDLQTTQSPGCPGGQTCWVDSANLAADSQYYGAGRCKPACTDDTQCQLSANNPFGGTNLKCAGETLADGTISTEKRCRANGECMNSRECPEIMDGGPYLGYCDRGSFLCKSDCRTGNDPITMLGFKDCRTPYSCSVNASGDNFCRLETCKEQGGAAIACSFGQYCCGDDKNADGVVDPCPPVGEQNAAGCYDAPQPPFCAACTMDSECTGNTPSWATCADGGLSVNCSPLASKCLSANTQDGTVQYCGVASVNDVSSVTLRYGPVQKSQLACPNGYSAVFEPAQFVDGNFCNTNADCMKLSDGGMLDAGTCAENRGINYRKEDGGYLSTCMCDARSGRSQCPSADSNGNVVDAFCKDGVSGSLQYCISGVYCQPPRELLTVPPEMSGCGLTAM